MRKPRPYVSLNLGTDWLYLTKGRTPAGLSMHERDLM